MRLFPGPKVALGNNDQLYIKNQNDKNMLILKVGLLFLYSSMNKKIPEGFGRLIFDIEKWLWRSELCCFWPSILKQWKGQKYFYAHFHSSLVLINSPLNSGACWKISLVTLSIYYARWNLDLSEACCNCSIHLTKTYLNKSRVFSLLYSSSFWENMERRR